jgi:hypothetical protein
VVVILIVCGHRRSIAMPGSCRGCDVSNAGPLVPLGCNIAIATLQKQNCMQHQGRDLYIWLAVSRTPLAAWQHASGVSVR